MNKQFYTFTRFKEDAYTSQNTRVRNLLGMAKLENRLLPYGIGSVPDVNTIDYKIVDKALDAEISASKKFLISAVNGSGGEYVRM